jgi:hypothetical protein
MASLADLFNPTFLMFLGILVLVVALLVVYFESKMREQNHKIASMLSLVSTLAEDMTGVKMGLNHLAIRSGQSFQIPINENLGNNQIINNNKLIEVSDDEANDEDEDEDENEDENEDDKSESDESEVPELLSDTDDEESDNESENTNDNNIKIIKLQVSDENIEGDNDTIEYDEVEDLDMNDELPEIDDEYVEQVLDLKYEEDEKNNQELSLEESNSNLSNNLKTISINLGDEEHHNEEIIDYKKLQLTKLRNIAVEKGLATNSEATKLKKPEILKLLGAE